MGGQAVPICDREGPGRALELQPASMVMMAIAPTAAWSGFDLPRIFDPFHPTPGRGRPRRWRVIRIGRHQVMVASTRCHPRGRDERVGRTCCGIRERGGNRSTKPFVLGVER